MTEQDLIFALDIGTRTVVGIVGCHDGGKFRIQAFEVEEHKERAMYDGQVHDIELVAKAVEQVREKLENRIGVKLKRVSVAAAGRTLKTCRVFVERDSDPTLEVDGELVSSLEIEAIQLAQKDIEEQNSEADQSFFCVGYAVVNYYLNGSIIKNLLGHKGKKIGVEVIATFLPRVVVESLYAVVARAGLEVQSLTLEPIAAMNVSIHSSLRLLNLALVDIGAGTSDIALTKDGTVFAFAMASTAGDEITEKIAQTLLLDFEQAEKVKICLNSQEKVKYTDIMGIHCEKSSEEIMNEIDPAIRTLAAEISSKIMEYNGKSPSAVFLVGGGSQIPRLSGYIAELLHLPAERVGVRSTDIIKDVDIKSKKLSGPEFITPIGIAVTAHMNRQKDFLYVTVNGVNVKLFNTRTLTIADSLILIGYNPRNLIGRRGSSVSFKLNGRTEVAGGEPGQPAVIYKNDVIAGLDIPIANGDRIIVEPALDGKPAEIFIRDYIGEFNDKTVYMNEDPVIIKPKAWINGKECGVNTPINNGDEVRIRYADKVSEIFEQLGLNCNNAEVYINGRRAELEDSVDNGDIISYVAMEKPAAGGNCINVTLNGKPSVIRTNKSQCIFVDVFNNVDIDAKSVKGTITMLLNGNKANYTDVLNEGDNIELYWE